MNSLPSIYDANYPLYKGSYDYFFSPVVFLLLLSTYTLPSTYTLFKNDEACTDKIGMKVSLITFKTVWLQTSSLKPLNRQRNLK